MSLWIRRASLPACATSEAAALQKLLGERDWRFTSIRAQNRWLCVSFESESAASICAQGLERHNLYDHAGNLSPQNVILSLTAPNEEDDDVSMWTLNQYKIPNDRSYPSSHSSDGVSGNRHLDESYSTMTSTSPSKRCRMQDICAPNTPSTCESDCTAHELSISIPRSKKARIADGTDADENIHLRGCSSVNKRETIFLTYWSELLKTCLFMIQDIHGGRAGRKYTVIGSNARSWVLECPYGMVPKTLGDQAMCQIRYIWVRPPPNEFVMMDDSALEDAPSSCPLDSKLPTKLVSVRLRKMRGGLIVQEVDERITIQELVNTYGNRNECITNGCAILSGSVRLKDLDVPWSGYELVLEPIPVLHLTMRD
eukprot:GEMP01009635.1.p1 GENE.GEMP01009635.1~~GEMP01009635.1.p1  ORF type:complete len:369 (+),score=49.06 GEMP01009635.1:25-1131(+)